ncbi:uncharacterized protein LOC126622684 [Malus sylvestris]|uniref:uncharacterized protein LOC126622684 n=1 Tax=Malus sylvestris TaxID=3752 RepID=UPI0021AC5A0A|nr:uncharacterized protein LOC126622684 [Malus sylvestris]
MTSLNFSNIETLTGSNYNKWKEDMEITLGMMDFDLALRGDKPAAITTTSTVERKTEVCSMGEVGNKFKESEKAETGNFPTKLASMKFDGVGNVREHILKMLDIAQKLNELEHPITD